HLIPSGILHRGKVCVIGNGVVVDPVALMEEIRSLRRQGIQVTPKNLVISETAHLVMPYHKILDEHGEVHRGKRKIGTTKRGIGPAYCDKASRSGLRALDLMNSHLFQEKLQERIRENNVLVRLMGGKPLSFSTLWPVYLRAAQFLRPFVRNAVTL